MDHIKTEKLREFLEKDIENVMSIYHHTQTGGIGMHSGPIRAMSECIEHSRKLLMQAADTIDDLNEHITFLKSHSLGWDNEMHR